MLSPDRNTGERDDVLFSFFEYTIRHTSLLSKTEVEKPYEPAACIAPGMVDQRNADDPLSTLVSRTGFCARLQRHDYRLGDRQRRESDQHP